MNNKKYLGQLGEVYACRFLNKLGYKIIDRNFHTRFGEIDIVAYDRETLVFIEVKTRTNYKFGLPEEAVTKDKLRKIRLSAEFYCLINKIFNKKLRIDVLALQINNGIVRYKKLIKVD